MGSQRVRQNWSDHTHRCMFQVNREKQQGVRSCKVGLPASSRLRNLSPWPPSPFLHVFIFSWFFQGKDMCYLVFFYFPSLLPKTFFLEDDTFTLADHNRLPSAFYPRSGGVRAKSLQSCPALCDPVDCSPPGVPSSVHEILQTGRLEWVSMPSSRRSSKPRDRTRVSMSPALAGGFFTMHAWAQGAGCVETASVNLKALPAVGGKALEGIRDPCNQFRPAHLQF